MENCNIEIESVIHLLRSFTAHCEKCNYSDELIELRNDINTFLFYSSVIYKKKLKSQLLWLHNKLYEIGVHLLHYETIQSSSFTMGCHCVVTSLDFALALFEESIGLVVALKGMSQDMSTLAPLSQIGLALKRKGLLCDSWAVLTRALDLSCQIEKSVSTSHEIPNFLACKSGVLQTLGDIQAKMGNLAQAKDFYDQAFECLKLDEVDEEGFENMVLILKKAGELLHRIEGKSSKHAAEYLELAHLLKYSNESHLDILRDDF